MTMDDERGRYATKRDRLARLTRLVSILQAHPDGIRTAEVAERVGMSVRTVYRDLRAIDEEIGVPVWADGGRWGIDQEKAFLPPLKLTQAEAMAVVLSARLMVRYADKYDPDLASAFEKLEQGLPPALAEHVERTLDVLSKAARDEGFSANVRLLTKAWAERRVVTIDYEPAHYDAGASPRTATVRPYLLEPSLQTHALYLIGYDEAREAIRTFKVERIRSAALTPRTFEPPDPAETTTSRRAAWDIIADQSPVEVVLRFAPRVAARVLEATWHPTQSVATEADGSLLWRATVAGTIEIRLWILSWGDDVEILAPATLRGDVAATLRQALKRYEETADEAAPPRARAGPARYPGRCRERGVDQRP
jgi:proteasome accessory factor B